MKVLIVYGIFLYHVALVFVTATWLVSNHERSGIFSVFVAFTFPWGIPAMFMISGADAWFGLRSHSSRDFIAKRIRRLLLPMAVGLVLLSPFQRFVTSHNPPPPIDQLPAFYLSFYRGFHFEWSMQWVSKYWLHLWFLGYLFVISLASLPLLLQLRREGGTRFVDLIFRVANLPGGLILFAAPLCAAQLILRPFFPGYQDWADVATYSFVFLWGAVMFRDRRFEALIRRDILLILMVGIGAALGIGYIFFTAHSQLNLTNTLATPVTLSFAFLWTFEVWAWLLAVLYLGMRWLDFSNRALGYLAESILPVYVLHHPVVLTVASIVVTWNIGVWPKFFAILISAVAFTLTLYEFGVRRWQLTRALFGLAPLPPPEYGTRPAIPAEAPTV